MLRKSEPKMEYVLATSTADRRRVDSTGREVHVGKPEQQELDVWPANPLSAPMASAKLLLRSGSAASSMEAELL